MAVLAFPSGSYTGSHHDNAHDVRNEVNHDAVREYRPSPFDPNLAPEDYASIRRRIHASGDRTERVEIVVKFGDGTDGHIVGLVARSASTNKRYLLIRQAEGGWVFGSPAQLQDQIRELESVAMLKRTALRVLGHQWTGE
jgi:hypothetical protein